MRRKLLITALLLVGLGVLAGPVAISSANNVPTTGTKISLFSPPATFPANTPFYIEHGFSCTPSLGGKISDCTNASTHFDLSLDGVAQPSKVDIDQFTDPFSVVKRNLTNYPAGLPAGTYTFTGNFVKNGSLVLTLTVTITFS